MTETEVVGNQERRRSGTHSYIWTEDLIEEMEAETGAIEMVEDGEKTHATSNIALKTSLAARPREKEAYDLREVARPTKKPGVKITTVPTMMMDTVDVVKHNRKETSSVTKELVANVEIEART